MIAWPRRRLVVSGGMERTCRMMSAPAKTSRRGATVAPAASYALDGKPALEEQWTAVHRDYVRKFGPEAATIGPPEGWDQETGAER